MAAKSKFQVKGKHLILVPHEFMVTSQKTLDLKGLEGNVFMPVENHTSRLESVGWTFASTAVWALGKVTRSSSLTELGRFMW
jgi:hypothetical protein